MITFMYKNLSSKIGFKFELFAFLCELTISHFFKEIGSSLQFALLVPKLDSWIPNFKFELFEENWLTAMERGELITWETL